MLYEDSAAVTGVVLALIGVGLHSLTGDRGWEGAASVAIGVLLVGVRLDLRDDLTAREVEELSNRIDRELREADPDLSQVFLDATPRPRRVTVERRIESDG